MYQTDNSVLNILTFTYSFRQTISPHYLPLINSPIRSRQRKARADDNKGRLGDDSVVGQFRAVTSSLQNAETEKGQRDVVTAEHWLPLMW